MADFDFGQLIIYIVVLLFAVSAHEAAHAWMSSRFGDDTARALGRVTLNPVAHTDPIGTLLIPIVNFVFASAGTFVPLLGWGKPTPVNPLRWRNEYTATVMVSAAGIMANTVIAISALVIVKALQLIGLFSSGAQLRETGSIIMGTMSESYAEPVALLLLMTLNMNASLALFNLLPFPPLDGSKILETFLPPSLQPALEFMEQYGYVVLLLVIYLGLTRVLFSPVYSFIEFLLTL